MLRFNPEQRAAIAKVDGFRRDARKADKKARPKSPKADRGRERDNGFLAFIRRQPCEARHIGGCTGPIQAAHIRYRDASIPNSAAAGVKNHDRHCNPLCAEHHRIQGDVAGERPFWAKVGKDAYETAAAHYARYIAGVEEQ